MLMGKTDEVGGRAWITPHGKGAFASCVCHMLMRPTALGQPAGSLGVAVTLSRPLPLRAV